MSVPVPPLRDVVQHLLAAAVTYRTPLKNSGYTEAVHAITSGHFDAFAATVGTTRTLLHDFLEQCHGLDDAMNIFRVPDADLHRDYLTARRVGKSGGGKMQPKDDGGAKPA